MDTGGAAEGVLRDRVSVEVISILILGLGLGTRLQSRVHSVPAGRWPDVWVAWCDELSTQRQVGQSPVDFLVRVA